MAKNLRQSKFWESAYQEGFKDGLERARRAADRLSAQEELEMARKAAASKAFDNRAIDRLLMFIVHHRLSRGTSLKEIAADMNITMKEARRLAKCRDGVPSILSQ